MIQRRFPTNIEALKFLVKLCSDMGLKEAGEYSQVNMIVKYIEK